MRRRPSNLVCRTAVVLCLTLPSAAEGGEAIRDIGEAASAAGPTWAESLENLGRVHADDEHPWLQELWLLGRYHGQYHWAEGSAGEDEGWEDRRFRVGAQGRFFRKLTLHGQMLSGPDFDPAYAGFTELWAQWAFDQAVALTVGQQKHRFTHDRTVSSRYLNTIERALLVNMVNAEYTPAVTLSGRKGPVSYYTGLFSNATSGDIGEAFTEFDSGASLLASVTFDLGRSLGTDTAHLNLGYLHSDANENAVFLNQFDNSLSTALILTRGPTSLVTEAIAGWGYESGDDYGFYLEPGWFLTDRIQFVGRYQLDWSDGVNGLVAQRRYERPAGLTTGDLYQAGYLGVNYYVAAHRIKLMFGAEYAALGGEEVWTLSSAVRVFWGPHSRGPFPMAQVLKAR